MIRRRNFDCDLFTNLYNFLIRTILGTLLGTLWGRCGIQWDIHQSTVDSTQSVLN
jgi:hypothetical protein